MKAENDEEGYTLTSFAPLSPDEEKTGLRKFFKELKSKTFTVGAKTSSHDVQTSLVNSAASGSQVSYVNSDITTRNKQLSKESPVVKGLYSKDVDSQTNCELQGSNQRKIVSARHSRTPSSVLRRLSQLVLLEKSYPQVYNISLLWGCQQ